MPATKTSDDTDVTTRSPAQIDERLSTIWQELYTKSDRLSATRKAVDKALASKARLQPNGRWDPWDEAFLADIQGKAVALADEIADLNAQAAPYEAEFTRRGGWERYFLVLNGEGHVHRGRHCATCYPTTRYGWLYALSGCDEAAMVAQYGHVACTRCFPNAPVEELARARDAALYCSGSGTYVKKPDGWRGGYNYRPCPDCGKVVTISKNSATLRKHKGRDTAAVVKENG